MSVSLSQVVHSTSAPPAFVQGEYVGRRKAMYYDFEGPKGAGYYAGSKDDNVEPKDKTVSLTDFVIILWHCTRS